jgi:hypothetical protein
MERTNAGDVAVPRAGGVRDADLGGKEDSKAQGDMNSIFASELPIANLSSSQLSNK